MHTIVLLLSLAVVTGLALLVFGRDRNRLIGTVLLWCAGAVIAFAFVLEAPYHMQYDDYLHYGSLYHARHAGIPAPESVVFNEWRRNDFIFYPAVLLLGWDYDNLVFFMKLLYVMIAPLGMMCSWLLFRNGFAAGATGVFLLACPVMIRFAGSVTLSLPGMFLYLLSVVFLLLFIERRRPVYMVLSVATLLTAVETKFEHQLFIPSYVALALAAGRTFSARDGAQAGFRPSLIAIAAVVLCGGVMRLSGGDAGGLSSVKTYAARMVSGYTFREFELATLNYLYEHAVLVPPAILVKLLALAVWRDREQRPVFLSLFFHVLMFLAVYSVSFVPGTIEQYRYSMPALFPLYALAGLSLAHLFRPRGAYPFATRAAALAAVVSLIAAQNILEYGKIPLFKRDPKYREYIFMKETAPKTAGCKILYVDYTFNDSSPGAVLWALARPEDAIPIRSVTIPGGALDVTMSLFNEHRSAASLLLRNRGVEWINTPKLERFLRSIAARDLSREGVDPQTRSILENIQAYTSRYGAQLPARAPAAEVWSREFIESLEKGECYLFYAGRKDMFPAGAASPDEPVVFIKEYLEMEETWRDGELSFYRVTAIR